MQNDPIMWQHKWVALHVAAENGCSEVGLLLLDRKANVNAENNVSPQPDRSFDARLSYRCGAAAEIYTAA